MTQNMFQEGLYQVFFKETPLTHPPTPATNHSELLNGRIHRWFGTVVNTRLLVTGVRFYYHVLVETISMFDCITVGLLHTMYFLQVVQILSALSCILATVTHACVSYNCSVSMTTPVWSSLFVSPHLLPLK